MISLLQRKLLPEFSHRLEFATAVFHAFAHVWECQLRYNPRLREKFGLTNGEGCERLWSRLRILIALCRGATSSHRLVNIALYNSVVNADNRLKIGEFLSCRHLRPVLH